MRATHVGAAPPTASPPGPRSRIPGSALANFEVNRLGFLEHLRDEYGGLVALDPITIVVNDPRSAISVLRHDDHFVNAANFLNRRIDSAEIAATKSARVHLNADMRATVLGRVELDVQAQTRDWLDTTPLAELSAVDPMEVFEDLFSRVVAQFFFTVEGDKVRPAVTALLDALSGVFGNPFSLPAWVPTRANRQVTGAYRDLRRLIHPMIARRIAAHPAQPGTSPLTAAGEIDYATRVALRASSAGHNVPRIANLLIGSLLAAQRVPAAAAAWSILHLSSEPGLAEATKQGNPSMTAVVLESTRLHPPTWLIQRTAASNVRVGGYGFRAGHQFLVSPYVIHRDEAAYPGAHAFSPDRWHSPHHSSTHTQFLGFGHGRHRCPGRDLGLLMVVAALDQIVDTHDLTNASDSVTPDPRSTLMPRGLKVALVRRGSRQADEPAPDCWLPTRGANRSQAD